METLYRAHGDAMLRYLRRSFGSCAPAEDLLQETFARALANRDACLSAESPRAFLFGIARHVGLTAARRARLRETGPLGDLEAKVDQGTEPLEAMRNAIDRLPPLVRETLAFRLREELSYEEIALVLGIPVGTVRSRLHTAMRLLRDELTREDQ